VAVAVALVAVALELRLQPNALPQMVPPLPRVAVVDVEAARRPLLLPLVRVQAAVWRRTR
jgi:hypothetical protein